MPMQCNSRHDMCSIATLTSHLPASPLHRRTFATWHFRTFALASSHFCSYALEAKVRSLKWPQQNSIQNCEIQIIYPYNRQGPHKLSSTLLCPLDKVRLGLEETLAADHSSHQTSFYNIKDTVQFFVVVCFRNVIFLRWLGKPKHYFIECQIIFFET